MATVTFASVCTHTCAHPTRTHTHTHTHTHTLAPRCLLGTHTQSSNMAADNAIVSLCWIPLAGRGRESVCVCVCVRERERERERECVCVREGEKERERGSVCVCVCVCVSVDIRYLVSLRLTLESCR